MNALPNKLITMRAILKSKHQRFCNWLLGAKDKLAIADQRLEELESEMDESYNVYLQKREELRVIILHYEETQNAIRNRVRQNRLVPAAGANPVLPVGLRK